MKITRLLLTLAVVPMALACSHDDAHRDGVHADRTSGDEHRDGDHGSAVVTRDTDHDGTDDTVAVRDDGPTALDQGESSSDVEITRQIRSAVMGDSSLSFGARNCVIVTQNGDVTLRGDVTAAESDAIERHAHAVAGVTHVTNDLHATDRARAD